SLWIIIMMLISCYAVFRCLLSFPTRRSSDLREGPRDRAQVDDLDLDLLPARGARAHGRLGEPVGEHARRGGLTQPCGDDGDAERHGVTTSSAREASGEAPVTSSPSA